jgi:uncharacterized protein DUF87
MWTGAGAATYAYGPRGDGPVGRDAELRREAALGAALSAAHGAGLELRLRLERTPEARLAVSVRDSSGRRWFDRAFAPIYAPGEWQRTYDAPAFVPAARWEGRRLALPGELEAPAPRIGCLLSAFDAALTTVGGQVAIEVGLRPLPPSPWGRLSRWLPLEGAPSGERPPTRSSVRAEPLRREVRSARPPALLWSASVNLWQDRPRGTDGPKSAGPLEPAGLSTAGAVLDGLPWRFVPVPLGKPPAFRSLLTDREMLAWMPEADRPRSVSTVRRSPPGLPIGRTDSGVAAELPVEVGQGRHFAVVGETGMGKSSLLVSIALRAGRRGNVLLLDPLGETAEALATELRRSGRRFRWIAPTALNVGINALGAYHDALGTDPVRAQREVDGIVQTLRRVRAARYGATPYWGPRLEEMLALAVRAAGSIDGGTLEDAHALLARLGFARTVAPADARPVIDELAARVRDRPDDAEGARRLLLEIVRDPSLRRLLCTRASAFAVADLVAPGETVLISGQAAVVGETTARYLLSMYLALLWAALLSRPGTPKTFVLLDEAQWFANESLGELLRLARRRNVHVGLATQSLASLEEGVREAVRTNVADLVVFRAGADEARELARGVPGLTADQLVGLPRGLAAALLGKGEALRWIRTARPPASEAGSGPAPYEVSPRQVEPRWVSASASPGLRPVGRERLALPVALVERLRSTDPAGLLEVDLADLRHVEGVDERTIRSLGGILGRSGALVRAERRAGGTVWWLDPARVDLRDIPGGGTGRSVRSASSQRL